MKSFEDINDESKVAPEALKEMLVSEIKLIRDAMLIVNMFMGEPMKAGLKFIEKSKPINEN